MNRKIIFLLAVTFCGSVLFANAQNTKPVMKFVSSTHDFGTFKEELGKQVHSFEFVNEGQQPIIINQVRSSCGCTSPSWTKNPVPPGQKGFVKAVFDPKNRPGPFNKSITITANTDPAVTILKIKGRVIEREKTIADIYPREMSGLRLKNNHLSLTKVKNTELKKSTVEVYNDSNEDISIAFERMPAHLQIKMIPEKLAPKQKGEIVALYDGAKKNDWGFVVDYVDLLVNQKHETGQRLTVSANIVEDFARLTDAEKQAAPKVEFNEKVFDFGELTQGQNAEHTFIMKNNGASDLIIHKTNSSCACTVIASQTKIIKAGEETEIKVVFSSKGRRGRQNKLITVITNDPVNSTVQLRVRGNVIMPES